MAENVEIPMEFKPLRGQFPVDFERQLGYYGRQRWIAFWWDDGEDAVMYNDGRQIKPSEEWQLWTTMIAPVNAWIRSNFRESTLGGTDEPATHALVWDRLEQRCYLSPREEADEFLEKLAKAG